MEGFDDSCLEVHIKNGTVVPMGPSGPKTSSAASVIGPSDARLGFTPDVAASSPL